MASLAATDPATCPGSLQPAEPVIPACMFAPDRGCAEDPCAGDLYGDGEDTSTESADHLDLSNKVGPLVDRKSCLSMENPCSRNLIQ